MDFSKTLLAIVFFSILSDGSKASLIRGFSVEFIPRNSPKSPFYDPTLNASQILLNSLRSSVSLVSTLTTTLTDEKQGKPVSNVRFGSSSSYLMNIMIGTPPVEILAIVDTGSDLIWTQCKPCSDCFKQKSPLFDPKTSSSYSDVPCPSPKCEMSYATNCSKTNTCVYEISYGDQSMSVGNIAEETIALPSTSGEPIVFPKTVFGCGHYSTRHFDRVSTGIVGLGTGSESLVSQMGEAVGGRFSYCLVPSFFNGDDKSSKLSFGDDAIVSGEGVVSTPLLTSKTDTKYYLSLVGITVGNKRIDVPSSLQKGNMVIDSGTTLSILPVSIYRQVESAVAAAIPLVPQKAEYSGLSLCYTIANKNDVKLLPEITVHFDGGADLKLNYTNAYFNVFNTWCLGFIAAAEGLGLYGNVAQMNYLVGYDMVRKVVSFKPTDCTNY